MSAAEVSVRAIPAFDAYPAGTTGQDVPVLFEIDTHSEALLNSEICVLLDKSGSMEGAKLRGVKEGVRCIIDGLGEGDLLHVVAYDSEAHTVLQNFHSAPESFSAAEAKVLVTNIRAGGPTNISAALARAEELLANSGAGQRGKRIFLLSDGCATRGLKRSDELKREAARIREAGIVISTFGIGQDFDEAIMKSMAEHGRGSYFYLRESVIRQTITDALRKLQTTVAVDATIRVQSLPPAGTLTRIFRQLEDGALSGEEEVYQSAEEMDAVSGTVRVGDLKVQGHKQQLIMACLSMPAGVLAGEEVPMLLYELRFRCPSTQDERRIAGTVAVACRTSGVHAPHVHVADVLQRTHPLMEGFTDCVERGDREAAMELQREVMHQLEEVQALDTRGYVSAQIRRLQRIADRVQHSQITSTQARLMVGEAMQRSDSGDLDGVLSPAGTPPAQYRTVPAPSLYRTVPAQYRTVPAQYRSVSPVSFASSTPGTPTGALTPIASYASPPGATTALSGPLRGHDLNQLWSHAYYPPALDSSFSSHEPSETGRFAGQAMEVAVTTEDSSFLSGYLSDARDAPHFMTPPPVSPPAPSALSKPEHLLADECCHQSLPSELFCPITHEVMTDPVVAQDGHTYERIAIQRWFSNGNITSPKTGQEIPNTALVPNRAIRAQIMTENERRAPKVATPSDSSSDSDD